MPIRRSAGAEIKSLIAALAAKDDVAREAAVARLAVMGSRGVDPLLAGFAAATSSRHRAGILRALETAGDARSLPLARNAINDPSPDVAAAAVGVLRGLLASEAAGTGALDTLISTALDRQRASDARLAAFDALRDLPAHVVDPVKETLRQDPDAEIAARLTPMTPASRRVAWQRATAGELPSAPDFLKSLIASEGAHARLTELQRIVDHLRTRELGETDAPTRAAWRAIRGAAHQTLAVRGSRLALYDLRDSLLEGESLPMAFLAAIEEIGDATCIEPLAAAYEGSSRSSDLWWREHLAAAFRAIVHREGLTRRHLVVKRALARWPEATADLMARS